MYRDLLMLPTEGFWLGFLAAWALSILCALCWPDAMGRKRLAWLPALLAVGFFGLVSKGLLPWQKLLACSLGLLYWMKAWILMGFPRADVRQYSPWGLMVYFSVWPGMDPRPFRQSVGGLVVTGQEMLRGYLFGMAGAGLMVLLVVLWPFLSEETVTWCGLFALLLMVHFGVSEILTGLLRLAGWDVTPLFCEPFQSRSLQDFWSRRWNLAFVQMDDLLFFRPLKKRWGPLGAVLGVFTISGVLHELAISLPVATGWGMPLAYFLFQGLMVLVERRIVRMEKTWPLFWGRVWTWFWLLAPLPFLFHEGFRHQLLWPMMQGIHGGLVQYSLRDWFDLALWLCALGHLTALSAGIQLPWRLHWKEDLVKLTPFNRKIFRNYYMTIGVMIIGFGTLTLVYHEALLEGDPVAMGLAALIATFWSLRILVDFVYFKPEDWPKGPGFVMGHALLTSVFMAMAASYWGLIAWHQLGAP